MDSDSFLQVLKIESDDFVVDEEETILLKVDYWKDMVTRSRIGEYYSKILEEKFMFGGDEWGFDFENDRPLDEDKLSPSQKENRTEARKYISMVKEAEKKYKKAYPHEGLSISHPTLKEVMTKKEVKEFKETQAQEMAEWEKRQTKKPKKPKNQPKKEKEDSFFMGRSRKTSQKVGEKETSLPKREYGANFDFGKISLTELESKLNSHEFKDLTDDQISERVAKLTRSIEDKNEQIQSKGRGSEKTYTKAAWKEYQKLITEVKELEEKHNSLPSVPTMDDAKAIRSKSKLENLGLKEGATNSEKLKALKNAYKKDLQEGMDSRKAITDKKKEIAEFNKKFRVGSTHAQNKLKRWIEERDSLLILISLRSQIAYVKFQSITDKLTTQEPEKKDFDDVPNSLYEFVAKALSDDDFKQLISVIEKLNVLHEESQGEKAKYLEDMREEVSYKGGESQEHKDSFNDFLVHRLEKFFRPIKVNNNAVRDDMKRNIERHLEEIIIHDPENTTIIVGEDIIESVNAEINEKIKKDEAARENIKDSSNLLDNVFRNVKEFHNKFDYDVSQPRSQSSEDALLFRIISQEVAGMSSQETFDSLEERNFFTDKNLYKLAKIISVLDEGRSEKTLEKALKISKRNQVTNHRKVVKVLHKEYGGEVGHRIFLRILQEHGIDLPSVESLKDATRDIVSRSRNLRGLEKELMDINQIFASPSMSDDLSFLMNPKYVQQMLDLAERSYFNTINEIDDDTNPDVTLPMKMERKELIRDTFGRLAYVGQYLNAISRGTEFLYSVNNQIIISNRVLENMSLTYPELKTKYADTLSNEVKSKIKKIVTGKEIDPKTKKPLKFSRPTGRPEEEKE